MGQKKVTVIDLSRDEDDQQTKVSQKTVKKSPKKAAAIAKGSGRLADKGVDIEDVILPEEMDQEKAQEPTAETPQEEETETKAKKPRVRSRRYKLARSQVDRTITYPLDQAIELLKRTSISRFDGAVTAHLNLTESGFAKEVAFPHSTGKTLKVAVANEDLIKKIEQKKIDFDILLATPEIMPKITKVAKILGPMGLMPNPKNNTITQEPEKRKKELESGKTQIKGESKAPLMHVVIGKTSSSDQHLKENLLALTDAIASKNIKKLTLASTMSPGIKVDLASLEKPNKDKDN